MGIRPIFTFGAHIFELQGNIEDASKSLNQYYKHSFGNGVLFDICSFFYSLFLKVPAFWYESSYHKIPNLSSIIQKIA